MRNGKNGKGRSCAGAAWVLAAALLLVRLLWPGTAEAARALLVSRRGAEAVEAFCRFGVQEAEAVFGGLWNG